MLPIVLLLTFHAHDWTSACTPWHQHGYPMGCYFRVEGPAKPLETRLRYDSVGGYWLVQEGALPSWQWLPLHDGDVLELDSAGVLRVKGLAQ